MEIEFEPEDFFLSRKRNIHVGAEIEMMLYDSKSGELLGDMRRCEEILQSLENRYIWHDYYPFQLELRSHPHNNVEDIISELTRQFNAAARAFSEEEIFIIPASTMGLGTENAFCGTHLHFSFDEDSTNRDFYKHDLLNAMAMIGWSSYPFIISIADITKNSEDNNKRHKHCSRILESRHIGIPPFREPVRRGHNDTNGWKDWIVNADSTDTKDVSTLEFRIFDTPSYMSHLRFLLDSTYSVISSIRMNTPMIDVVEKAMESPDNALRDSLIKQLKKTRQCMDNPTFTFNSLFRRDSYSLMKKVGRDLGFDVPTENHEEITEEMAGSKMQVKKIMALRRRGESWNQLIGGT